MYGLTSQSSTSMAQAQRTNPKEPIRLLLTFSNDFLNALMLGASIALWSKSFHLLNLDYSAFLTSVSCFYGATVTLLSCRTFICTAALLEIKSNYFYNVFARKSRTQVTYADSPNAVQTPCIHFQDVYSRMSQSRLLCHPVENIGQTCFYCHSPFQWLSICWQNVIYSCSVTYNYSVTPNRAGRIAILFHLRCEYCQFYGFLSEMNQILVGLRTYIVKAGKGLIFFTECN